jgi:hypothetical protein
MENLLALQHRSPDNFALPDASGRREHYSAGAFRYGMFESGEWLTEGTGWFANPRFRDFAHGGVFNGRAVWALGEVLAADPHSPLAPRLRDALALTLRFCLHDALAHHYTSLTPSGLPLWNHPGEHGYLLLGLTAACRSIPDFPIALHPAKPPRPLRDITANALDTLTAKVNEGQIRNVKGNSYSEDLVNEDALAGIVWSGDITVLNAEAGYEKWKFVLPESGGTFWNDTFIIPIGSPRKTNAETLINWYYDPAIAAELAAWVNYVTPVKGAFEEAIKIDPALAENQWIFPNADTLKKVHIFRSLSDAEETEFQAAFQGVVLG